MVDLSGTDRAPSIVDRAKAIILTPKDEWSKIATETTPQGDILRGYVLPLAAIGPLAGLIGSQIFGYGALGFSYRPTLVWSLSTAVISFALAIVNVFLLTIIADMLAPQFGGRSNRNQAFKLVAYSFTAAWLAGIFGLITALALFGILGLYSLYLFYTGSSVLMGVPQEKAIGYTAVTVVCGAVLMIVAGILTSAVTGLWATGPASVASGEISGKVTVPGGGTIDLDKVQQATRQMEDAANGKSPPVSSERMKALLPPTIGAYQRTATEAMAMGAMGSTAEGTYMAGDKSFSLRLSDMSALGAAAGLGAALGVSQSKEDADSYERVQTVNGQVQIEAWNRVTGTGKYGVSINNRFMVQAEGTAANIDELKQAVAAIDPEDLADLVG